MIIIGFIGTALMAIAYIINLIDWIDDDHPLYIVMNLVGALMAVLYAYSTKSYPFLFIESIWALASAWGLYIYITRDFLKIKK